MEEQETKGTYSEVCMSCLNVSSNLKCLLIETDLLTKFATFTNLEIEITEKTSYFLCIFCEEKLVSSYNFQQQCKTSYDIIKFGNVCYKSKEYSICEEAIGCNNYDEFNCDLEGINCSGFESGHDESDDEFDESTRFQDSQSSEENTDAKTFSEDEILAAVADHKNKFHNLIFDCLFCSYIADGVKSLAIHVGLKHKEMKGKWCSRCNVIVENNVEEHINSHTLTSDCTLCGEKIKLECMIVHILSHSEVKKLTCKICSKVCSSSRLLKKHWQTHDNSLSYSNDEDVIQNDTENSDENTDVSMQEQENDNVTDEPSLVKNNCNFCGTIFATEKKLKTHMKVHLGNAPYKCRYCDKRMMTRTQIVEHERIHTGEKPYVCGDCGKRFTQAGALRTHSRQHTGRTEVCNICNKTFCRKSELKLHKAKHAGFKPYLCTICGQSFFQQSHLTNHLKIHSNERPFKCQSCEKSFKQRSQLTAHMHIHTGTKPHICDKCGNGFFTLFGLNTHEKTHEKKQYYQCEYCPRKFRNGGGFSMHISKHRETMSKLYEGDFECKYCPRKFKKETGLMRHLVNHEDDKPFKCLECTFSASKRHNLLLHIKREHVQVSCRFCDDVFLNKEQLAIHLENTVHFIPKSDSDENKQ